MMLLNNGLNETRGQIAIETYNVSITRNFQIYQILVDMADNSFIFL